jgi:hypothetical protein
VYSEIPINGAGDMSFTRASNGTRINSQGLVEVCPWNLLQQSENFPNAVWGKSTLTFNSTVTAPNGTSTAQNYSTGGAFSYALQVVSVASGEYYTSSCYLKYTSGVGSIAIRYSDSSTVNFISVTANLINGTIGSVSYGGNGANGTATITSVGDGWYRVTVSGTLTIANAGFGVSNNAFGATTFSIWGAQLNIGSTAKPYFPTTDRINVPRLTYQNGGGGCPSLLLEKQSTNLNLYSQDLTNAAYTTGGSGGTVTRTANYGISPDGTQNATRMQFTRTTGAGSYAEAYQRLSATIGATYTLSFWGKSLNGTPKLYTAWNGGAYENEVTFTSDWVRYTYTYTVTSLSSAGFNLITYQSLPTTSTSADILIWGVQFEASSYATSYIVSTSSSATRVADACFKTGISSLIGQSQGVLFVDLVITGTTGNNRFSISDGSNTNWIFIATPEDGGTRASRFYIKTNGSVAVDVGTSSYFTFGQRYKMALAYKSGDWAVYVNGTLLYSGTTAISAVSSPLSVFNFFNATGGNADTGEQVNQAILFPTRLTNAELASLTTI